MVLLQCGNTTQGPLPSSALVRDGAGKSNLRVKGVGQVEAFQANSWRSWEGESKAEEETTRVKDGGSGN